jgi:hypothetical protein
MEKAQRVFYCTVCDWNLVDMDDPKTGTTYTVYGALMEKRNTKSATLLVCVCPQCKAIDALAPTKAFAEPKENEDEQAGSGI